MTVEALKDCNKKVLARMAKDQGITGWHAMRKDQLIRALGPVDPSSRNGGSDTTTAKRAAVTASPPRRPVVPVKERTMATLPSRPRTLGHDHVKDRIITMVRDPYWLHTYWELSRATLGRAQAALGQDWHAARPILRLMDVTAEDTTTASERHIRDIPIHGGVNNWYIDVTDPPRSYRVDVGYLSQRGKFFVLARSNVVAMPRAGVSEPLDQNWASVQQDAHRIYHQSGGSYDGPTDPLRELLEERLGRPMQTLSLQSLMTGALAMPGRGFHFEIDAELIVYGTTEPNARVCLGGEPVPLRDDGTFTVRFSLPDARQIIPATAASPDGVEERTIVLAVERNTKELEPMIHDGNEL